jgi:2-oxoglutarate ferredoxin oxidoreductase subunit alpha
MHARMNEKRFHKLDVLHERGDLFCVTGDPDAELVLISWGSTAGVCREALQLAQDEGLRVKLLVPYLLYPVAEEIYRRFLAGVQAGLVVEQSYQGQLYRILRMFLDLPVALRSFAQSGANPFQPGAVVARLRAAGQHLQGQA